MQKNTRSEAGIIEQVSANDNTAISTIKPASKNEVGVTAYIREPNGISSLEVNARSLQDIEDADNTGRFWTTCLHSDIAKWRNKHGIEIIGESEKYTSTRGYSAYFTRYRIANREAAQRAINLINYWRRTRGAEPLCEDEALSLIAQFPEKLNAA